MRSWILVAAVFGLAAGAAEPAPTPAALRKAFENNARSLVRVTGPKGTGAGVIVGADGHVVTSVAFVGLRDAEVEVEGHKYPAQVLAADAYQGIAVVQLQLPAGSELRAAPVRLDAELSRGQQLVAVRLLKSGPSPLVVAVRRKPKDLAAPVELDQFLPRGTPVFDAKGKLLGVMIGGRRMLPIGQVKQQLVSASAP